MAKKLTAAEQQAKRIQEAQALGKSLGLEYENIADIQRLILNNQVKSTEELLKQVKLARQAQDIVEDELKKKKLALEYQEAGTDLARQMLDIEDSIKKAGQSIFSNTEDTYTTLTETVKKQRAAVKQMITQGKISSEIADETLKNLNAQEKGIDKLKEIQEQYKSQYDLLTGIGGFLSKNFGEVGKILQGSINKGMSAFTDALAEGQTTAEATNAAMKAFGGGLTANIAKMFSVVGLAIMLYDAFIKASHAATEMAKETGITYGQAKLLGKEAKIAAASFDAVLATSKDIIAVQSSTIKEFGTMAMLSTDTAAQVAEMGKAFGYGAEAAAGVNNAFMAMGASQSEAVETQRALATEALRAGVNVGTVTADIAQNAKLTSKYFGGNVTALKDAAVQAAKMGVSIKGMVAISDKLLDIESSLQSQFEFQALTGKQINLDKARELALGGKIAEASQLVYEQIGGIAEFEAMRPLERKKLAEMMGMEVDELEKSLVIQEKMKDLTEEEMAAYMNLGLSAKEIEGMSDKELQNRLAQQQSLEKSNAALAAAKDQISIALVPIAEVFAGILASIAPIVKAILYPFQLIGQTITFISDQVSKFIAQFEWLQGIITFIKHTFDVIGAILGGVLIPYLAIMARNAIRTAGAFMAKAIGVIFTSFGQIPFGIGIPLAFGAIAGAIALYSKFASNVGDLAMGDGPIVASPREGAIFQGTRNDEVAMGPGVINAAQSSGGTTVVQQGGGTDNKLLQTMITELKAIKAALSTPVPVQIGDRVITEIGTQLAVQKSYRTGYGGR